MKKSIPAGFTSILMLALSVLFMSQTKPVTKKNPAVPGLKASIARGQEVYLQQCLSCHQADGGGVQNLNPPLIKTKYVLGDKTKLIKIVLDGLSGELEVGDDTYHNVMAPHRDLSDQEIADVLTYIRNSFGNKASAVTAAQVKVARALK